MKAVFRHVRGLEGPVLTAGTLGVLHLINATPHEPSLLLTAGVVYAATRGTLITGLFAVLISAAMLGWVVASGNASDARAAFNATVSFLLVGSVIAGIVADLGYRSSRQVTAEREYATRMAELESAKTSFLQLASHELRGPLGIINGYVNLLEEGTFGPVSAADIRVPAPILRAKVGEMQTLVDSLLESARLDEARLALQKDYVDLRDVVDDAIAAISPIASPLHEIRWTLPDEVVPVSADRTRLQLIVTGLLHNAVKYSPDGGLIETFLSMNDGFAVISIWDHGLGIAAVDLPVLFTRFGRVVTPENAHIGGIGLGLYLARELARLHGGDVDVKSLEGKGSTFTATIPLVPEQPTIEIAAAHERHLSVMSRQSSTVAAVGDSVERLE